MSIDLSLERLDALLPLLPRYTRPTIHIAGTNGKGSVSALLSSILSHTQPPLSTGRFNSPHLVHITDCILTNGTPVSSAAYLAAKTSVQKANKGASAGLTPFEILTLTALQLFEAARVDIVVVEVGMGGRLDATNVIPSECILVSALTAVDLDHQRFLGSTISAIAAEKAGIARAGKPFVLGPQRLANRADVEEAVFRIVNMNGGEVVRPVDVSRREWDEGIDGQLDENSSLATAPFNPPPGTPIRTTILAISPAPIHTILPLHGAHQLDNLSTSLGIVQALLSHPSCLETSTRRGLDLKTLLTADAVEKGVRGVEWRGRLSWHVYAASSSSSARFPSLPMPVLVDGAHNPASSQTLAEYIQQIISNTSSHNAGKKLHITYILALSHSPPKSPKETLEPLFLRASDQLVSTSVALTPFTPPTDMPWVTFVPPEELAEVVKDIFASFPPAVSSGPPAYSTSPAIWTPPNPVLPLTEGGPNAHLKQALSWAASQRRIVEEKGDMEHLVIVAGSLYLVADFYRLLEGLS